MKRRWFPVLLTVLLLQGPVRADDGLADGIAAYEAGDFQSAKRILTPLAEAGDAGAQYYLGRHYWDGRAAPRDTDKALHWLRRAARSADARALYLLGRMAETGDGLDRNMKRAECLYFESARRGYANAQYAWYTVLWDKGDHASAQAWLERALLQGQAGALFRRGYVLGLNPLQFDKTQAFMYLLLAEARGSRLATEELDKVRKANSPRLHEQLERAGGLAREWRDRPESVPGNLSPPPADCIP